MDLRFSCWWLRFFCFFCFFFYLEFESVDLSYPKLFTSTTYHFYGFNLGTLNDRWNKHCYTTESVKPFFWTYSKLYTVFLVIASYTWTYLLSGMPQHMNSLKTKFASPECSIYQGALWLCIWRCSIASDLPVTYMQDSNGLLLSKRPRNYSEI